MNEKANNSRETLSLVMTTVGLLAIMTAAFLPLIHVAYGWTRYVYAAGAVILFIGRLVAPRVKDAPLRLRRLLHMEVWTALIFMAGAVFMFLPSAGGKDWIAFTLAGGFLTLYTSIMIPRQKVK
ncbi:MAG: hypothetical protein NC411_07925 [Bacteroides sp.]|nr:hypothetical protein [Bacteroides sp.]